MIVRVCFDRECFDVAAIPDPFDADKLDYTRTIANAEALRARGNPEPLDREAVEVSVKRVVE